MKKTVSDVQVLYEKAMESFICNGEVEKSIELMEIIIKDRPGFVQVYYDLGFLYNMKGNSKKAVKYYEKYLDLNPIALDRYEIMHMIIRLKKEASLKNTFNIFSFSMFSKFFNKVFKSESTKSNLKQLSY